MGNTAKKIYLGLSCLALLTGGILGFKELKDTVKRHNISALANNLSSLCNEKDTLKNLEKQYAILSKNPDKIYESTQHKKKAGKELAESAKKSIDERLEKIGNLEASVKGLDEKIADVDLSKTAFETYLDFRNLGYIFCDSETNPAILKIESQNSNVYFCREKTKGFEGFNKAMSAFTLNTWGDVIIDLDSIERISGNMEKGWDYIKKNNEYYETSNPKWNPYLQSLYNLLKNEPNRKEAFKTAMINGSIMHEKQHIEDNYKDYSKADLETRAYLKELALSPEALIAMYGRLYNKADDEAHKRAAIKVVNGLLDFKDIKSEKEIFKLSNSEIAERAKILFGKFYPKK